VEGLNGKSLFVYPLFVIRYSWIIACADGGVRPLIDAIPNPVIANDPASLRAGK